MALDFVFGAMDIRSYGKSPGGTPGVRFYHLDLGTSVRNSRHRREPATPVLTGGSR